MREIEEAPVQPRIQDTYAGVVAEAAPMTAAEIAAQAREEQSAQRGKREEELEAEKDDAARLLEDEFEEMEGLEERVRKLREKREALRTAHAQTYTAEVAVPEPPPAEEDESESEDEDWDDWRFRPA
jgi:beta-phosphoglucomutase-like phosphatase (HAD superfamily)